jgi:sn-glycerol 3-phosphate transport system ATP-binding protein
VRPDGLRLTIDLVDPLGSETVLIGRLDGGELVSIKVHGAAPPGDTLHVAIPPAMIHVFDAATGLRLYAGQPAAIMAVATA